MRTLPTNMLRHEVVLTVPEHTTGWHQPDGSLSATLTRVHIQQVRSMDAAGAISGALEVRPAAVLWIDGRLSKPTLDYIQLQQAAEIAGGPLRISYGGIDYRVRSVMALPDGYGRLHHWELELI